VGQWRDGKMLIDKAAIDSKNMGFSGDEIVEAWGSLMPEWTK
jgi:hypothetical protein